MARTNGQDRRAYINLGNLVAKNTSQYIHTHKDQQEKELYSPPVTPDFIRHTFLEHSPQTPGSHHRDRERLRER